MRKRIGSSASENASDGFRLVPGCVGHHNVREMRKVTRWFTIFSIIAGIGMVSTFLFVPLVGIFIGLIMVSPLFVTLIMSNLLVGNATQVILFGSTAGYLTNLIYKLYFSSNPDDALPLVYSIPVMIVFWFAAGFLSLTRDEIENRHIKNKIKYGR